MTQTENNTPILIGVGQVTLARTDQPEQWCSHADLAARAVECALNDALDESIKDHIDAVAAVKTFADSSPAHPCPFGMPSNFPRAVTNRLGFSPRHATYEILGGQAPQKLVGEYCERLAKGEFKMALLLGSEVIANIKSASRSHAKLDWTECIEGQLEDRGLTGGHPLITRLEFEHKLMMPMQFYGLMENAYRAEQKRTIDEHLKEMGRELEVFSKVASKNQYAVDQKCHDANKLAMVTETNPMVMHPFTKGLVAKDNVNQAAAVILTTVGNAKKLGIGTQKWVYLHGYSDTRERVLLERTKLSGSEAMAQSLLGALHAANLNAEQIEHFDIYSCFPVVVSKAKEILEISQNDPRPLTQTGGLPFFGGPGNNYSMHAIASMVETLRREPGSYGLIYANGGVMTKHSTGIYSTTPPKNGWRACDSAYLQEIVDSAPACEIDYQPNGEAVLETYTLMYMQGQAMAAAIVGSMKNSDKRFFAITNIEDQATFNQLQQNDPIGETIFVNPNPRGNQFAFSREHLKRISPKPITDFKENYEYCLVEKQGNILVVTINRPEVLNALNPMANEELEGIFNAYEKDNDLWVAILTSAENRSFSTGNDLKYMAQGGELWVPKTGFAGLTKRQGRVKPVIAAVNGAALGGGLEIAMACDIIIAADHAQFGLPEVKVGLIAMMGGVQRLSQAIGVKPATEMMITGDAIDCERALQLGLINKAVPYDQLLDEALRMAKRIASASPTCVSCTLELQKESAKYASVEESVSVHYDTFDRLLNSEDFFEGPKAFAEKRAPRWTGK